MEDHGLKVFQTQHFGDGRDGLYKLKEETPSSLPLRCPSGLRLCSDISLRPSLLLNLYVLLTYLDGKSCP